MCSWSVSALALAEMRCNVLKNPVSLSCRVNVRLQSMHIHPLRAQFEYCWSWSVSGLMLEIRLEAVSAAFSCYSVVTELLWNWELFHHVQEFCLRWHAVILESSVGSDIIKTRICYRMDHAQYPSTLCKSGCFALRLITDGSYLALRCRVNIQRW